MKKNTQTLYILCASALFLLVFGQVRAQTMVYGNDWYKANPNANYVKLLVAEDGIYRVTATDLTAAGFDVSGINADALKLIYRGKEVRRYIEKTATNQLVYLEFFGKRNDGRIDSLMYRHPSSGLVSPNEQPNVHTSLFSDTTAYFLTWITGQLGQKYFKSEDLVFSGNAEPHFRYKSLLDYGAAKAGESSYILSGGGPYDSFNALNTDYITGEGYLSKAGFSFGRSRIYSVATPGYAQNGSSSLFEVRVFGRSQTPHHLRVEINGDAASPLIDDSSITNSRIYLKTHSVSRTYSLPNKTDFECKALRSPTDNNHIAWAAVTYDRQCDLSGGQSVMITDFQKTSKAYFRFTNVDGNADVYIYDLTDGVRARGSIQGSTGQINVPFFGNSNKRQLFLATDKGIKKPVIKTTSLNKLFDPNDGADYVIISNRKLATSAEAYRNYRDTATVTPFKKVKLVYVDEIYDEYSFGSPTPWAIKRFCKDALDNWTIHPRYFLFFGKGQYLIRGKASNLVPAFGYPASDHEYVGHYDFNSTSVRAQAAVGRINAKTNAHGFVYLNKVIEYEHTPFEPWMKEVVFLGGGATAGEQRAIRQGLEYYIDKVESKKFGGNATYFQKTKAGLPSAGETADYHDNISGGVSLIHFFGHSSSNILDISLKEAFEYNNYGRYPLIFAMGCYGGDFTIEETFGERWLLEERRGAIAYFANSSAGYLNPLKDYGRIFYSNRYRSIMDSTIGYIIQQSLNKYVDSLPGIQYRNHGRQLNLQGDPAIKFYTPKRPDLAVSTADIFFSPDNFSAQSDSFFINVIVHNYGRATEDSFVLELNHTVPGGVNFSFSQKYPMVDFQDTISIRLFNKVGELLAGQNRFSVFLDAKEEISELKETNNRTSLNHIVPGNIPANLYPPEFAVIGKDQLTLEASAFFMTREKLRYRFEIDTVAEFNSPAKFSSPIIEGKATYAKWDVPFSLKAEQVYFWRVSLEDVTPRIWGNSSFKYIPSRSGWAQARADQFVKDKKENIELNLLQKNWNFEPFKVAFEFATAGRVFIIKRNGSLIQNLDTEHLLSYLIIDQHTLEPITPFGKYGYLQPIRSIPSDLQVLKNVIRNMKHGDYMLLETTSSPNISHWDQETLDLLAEIGVSTAFQSADDSSPFIILGRKGYPGSAIESYNKAVGGQVQLNTTLISHQEEGTVESVRIGPAADWDEMYWNWESLDRNKKELARVDVYGVRRDNTDSLILKNIPVTGVTRLDVIDHEIFPFLRLSSQLKDSIFRTAPQLKNWHVLHAPVPDAVVDPFGDFSFKSDTLSEGDIVSIKMGAINITDIDMDSLKIKFYAIRPDRSRIILGYKTVEPLLANGRVTFDFEFSTKDKNLGGDMSLVVELNPDFDQLEQYHFNNIYIQTFKVNPDDMNPILDVTFDGKHIIDGDIVSPTPEILIEINDENKFVALDDSSNFEIFFKENSPVRQWEAIAVNGDPRIEWIPAKLPENKAQVIFRPGINSPLTDTKDGYIIRVQGKDTKGNASGIDGSFYEVSFKVVTEASITHVINYPNPFSTSTRFVYTLTGSEVPEKFQIHIFTISGKIVKVIDLLEMGDLSIGKNITNYAWDGTDEFGDKLGNGVYLYRVVSKMAGTDELKLKTEGTDQYFKNGWGKMYIMR